MVWAKVAKVSTTICLCEEYIPLKLPVIRLSATLASLITGRMNRHDFENFEQVILMFYLHVPARLTEGIHVPALIFNGSSGKDEFL